MSTGTCNVKSTRACRRSIGLEGNMRGSVSGRSQGARDTAYSGRTVRGARARALKRRIYIRATRIAVDRSQIGSRRLNETRGVSVAAPSPSTAFIAGEFKVVRVVAQKRCSSELRRRKTRACYNCKRLPLNTTSLRCCLRSELIGDERQYGAVCVTDSAAAAAARRRHVGNSDGETSTSRGAARSTASR